MNNMETKIVVLTLTLIFSLMSCEEDKTGQPENNSDNQENNYGYENWPGKNGAVKSNIEFPTQLISQYDLTLARGFTSNFFFYKLPLDENDTIKSGRLQAQIFSSIDTAQLALVNYLNILTTPVKPPRLTNEDFKTGDVTFGEERDGILWMVFTRNNVLVIVDAPLEKAKDIAQIIDEAIQNAPEWKEGMPEPMFILPEKLSWYSEQTDSY